MNEQEIFVEQTENVEQTTEQTPVPKTYTQEEVDAIVGKAKARAKAKVEKDYQRRYGDLEEVLKAGTGKNSVEEFTNTFAEFYKSKGINKDGEVVIHDSVQKASSTASTAMKTVPLHSFSTTRTQRATATNTATS